MDVYEGIIREPMLANDISETTDVAAQHSALLRQFDVIVAREHTPTHINDWEIISPKTTAKVAN
ncbi:hypothetical protein WBJ53_24005 [Spirosoma sp. SC4-14]|uniref:hypothetical protein n=1 Tax=Spirosoma sp. SC4-14 TaxID=3128900 RepID=UPI0030D06AAD